MTIYVYSKRIHTIPHYSKRRRVIIIKSFKCYTFITKTIIMRKVYFSIYIVKVKLK